MYIIHESTPSNDPRLHPLMQIVGDYWHFTIRHVPPNKGIYIDWLAHEKLTEEVAMSYKVIGSHKGVVSVSRPVTKISDITRSSGEVEWKKFIYKLNVQDKENVVKLMKSAMRLFAQAHLADQKALKRLLNEVALADTVEKCQYVMYHYYNVDSAFTNKTERDPKFNVVWPEKI